MPSSTTAVSTKYRRTERRNRGGAVHKSSSGIQEAGTIATSLRHSKGKTGESRKIEGAHFQPMASTSQPAQRLANLCHFTAFASVGHQIGRASSGFQPARGQIGAFVHALFDELPVRFDPGLVHGVGNMDRLGQDDADVAARPG